MSERTGTDPEIIVGGGWWDDILLCDENTHETVSADPNADKPENE